MMEEQRIINIWVGTGINITGRRCIPRPISHVFVGTTNTTKDKWSGYLPYLTIERRKQGILSKKGKKKKQGPAKL